MIKSENGIVEAKGSMVLIMAEVTALLRGVAKMHRDKGFPDYAIKEILYHAVDVVMMEADELKMSTKKLKEEVLKEMLDKAIEKDFLRSLFDDMK